MIKQEIARLNANNYISVQFSCSDVSNSLRPDGLQHTRSPCPSPTPEVCSNSCPLVGDAIQPSDPLSSPSPPTFHLSQRQGWLFASSLLTVYRFPPILFSSRKSQSCAGCFPKTEYSCFLYSIFSLAQSRILNLTDRFRFW